MSTPAYLDHTPEDSGPYVSDEFPSARSLEVIRRLDRCESRSMHGQLPIEWDHADGHFVYDSSGNCWIDFTSTIFVANIGHSNPLLKKYVKDAIDKSAIACYAYANRIRADYIEELLDFAGDDFQKAFLLSAGTEATEAALKLMRMYGRSISKRKPGIVCISGNWHGRTMGAQLMSDNQQQREWIGFSDPNIHHIAFPYPWDVTEDESIDLLISEIARIEKVGIDLSRDVCGFMLETFQGWGAVFYPKTYVQTISKVCRENSLLLCFDEMQSGFGRTGMKFGFQHYDVTPDLFACGKGMGGGLPLSAVIGKSEIMDLPAVGNMSSTHSANPLCCAAGLAVLHEIRNKDLVNRSQELGNYLRTRLERIALHHKRSVKAVSSMGLIGAIVFKDTVGDLAGSSIATRACHHALKEGLLVVHTGRESIKIGPPLTISMKSLDEGLTILEKAIDHALSK